MRSWIHRTTEHRAFITYAQIFLIYLFPIGLFYFGILETHFRMLVLACMCLCIYGIMVRERLRLKDIGLFVPIKKYLTPYLFWTVLGVLFLIGYAVVFDFQPKPYWWMNPHFWLLFVAISFFQEFAYRGFLPILLKRVSRHPVVHIGLNAFLFMILHVLFPHLLITLPLAFLGGLFFSTLYYFYPDLVLVSFSHAILNFVAVMFGFFVLAV